MMKNILNNWKTTLISLEHAKQWDKAITFLQGVIEQHPNDVDAAICMNYLMMNLLLEEQYDESKSNHYQDIAVKHFYTSYKKFNNDPGYLFCAGWMSTAMARWFFGIMDDTFAASMEQRALLKSPDHPLFLKAIFLRMDSSETPYRQYLYMPYAKYILDPESSFKPLFSQWGSFGEHMIAIYTNDSKDAVNIAKYYEKLETNLLKFFIPDSSTITGWKDLVLTCESNKRYTDAIDLLKNLISSNNKNKDAYIFLLNTLSLVLTNEDLDFNARTTHQMLFSTYFNQSRTIFADDHEYHFYVFHIINRNPALAYMSHEELEQFRFKAIWPAQDNLLFQWAYYQTVHLDNELLHAIAHPFAQIIINKPAFKIMLDQKGSCGTMVWHDMVAWAQKVLAQPSKYPVEVPRD